VDGSFIAVISKRRHPMPTGPDDFASRKNNPKRLGFLRELVRLELA